MSLNGRGSTGRLFATLLATALLLKDCEALKLLSIQVPPVVKSGSSVTLSCDYDLEQAALYTIKWYRYDVEFYRYVPKESPPSKAFPVPFMNVDLSKSGPNTVTLRGLRRELSGVYKCEVSADAPLFHTEIHWAKMTVTEFPSGGPKLTLDRLKVELGKKISAECVSSASDPPANLTWYVNHELVNHSSKNLKFEASVISDKVLGMQSSRSGLQIVANRSHFAEGNLTIVCQATILSIWNATSSAVVVQETPQPSPVVGPTISQSHSQDNRNLSANSLRPLHQLPTLGLIILLVLLAR